MIKYVDKSNLREERAIWAQSAMAPDGRRHYHISQEEDGDEGGHSSRSKTQGMVLRA